jgi:hypothetical protein
MKPRPLDVAHVTTKSFSFGKSAISLFGKEKEEQEARMRKKKGGHGK